MPTSNPANAGCASTRAASDAERRRDILRRLMQTHAVNAAELARRTGMARPNAFYNFLSGRTSGLSHTTLERILAVFPDEEALGLIGRKPPPKPTAPPDHLRSNAARMPVRVTMQIQAEYWARSAMLPGPAQFDVAYPAIFVPRHHGLFAALVTEPGPDGPFPIGSVLICRPFVGAKLPLPAGVRVVVVTERSRRFNTSVETVPQGASQDWCQDTPGTHIAGIVTGAWQPDWAALHA